MTLPANTMRHRSTVLCNKQYFRRPCAIVRWLFAIIATLLLSGCQQPELSEREQKRLLSLSLQKLGKPSDLSNRYANDPLAQSFGQKLFFDTRLSVDNTVSCATCHLPEKGFTDGLKRAKPQFTPDTDHPALRNTPTVTGSAWHTWQYWDGRRDSLWAQALTPIEAPAEMGNNRAALVRLFINDEAYKQPYEAIFGPVALTNIDIQQDASPVGTQAQKRQWYQLPNPVQTSINQVFANIGKALAAYQTTLRPAPTRFDRFAEKLASGEPYQGVLTDLEYQGARLFVNEKKTQCLECHNGPLLSNGDFHNIGSATFTGDNMDFGRILGVQAVMIDEFNCHGRYSDARADQCQHLNFMSQNDFVHTQGGFRTPTLRNAANTAPYFHDGRFASLEEVINHYVVTAETEQQTELRKFPLTPDEIDALVAFIKTLSNE